MRRFETAGGVLYLVIVTRCPQLLTLLSYEDMTHTAVSGDCSEMYHQGHRGQGTGVFGKEMQGRRVPNSAGVHGVTRTIALDGTAGYLFIVNRWEEFLASFGYRHMAHPAMPGNFPVTPLHPFLILEHAGDDPPLVIIGARLAVPCGGRQARWRIASYCKCVGSHGMLWPLLMVNTV